MSLRDIANIRRRDVSTFSRERKRETVQQIETYRKPYSKYFPDPVARVYKENCSNCGSHSTIMEAWEFIEFAERSIQDERWSYDIVVVYAKRHDKFEYIPSIKTLYNWFEKVKLPVKNIDWKMKFRCSIKKKKSRKNKNLLDKSIKERLESIETREEFGHWGL